MAQGFPSQLHLVAQPGHCTELIRGSPDESPQSVLQTTAFSLNLCPKAVRRTKQVLFGYLLLVLPVSYMFLETVWKSEHQLASWCCASV